MTMYDAEDSISYALFTTQLPYREVNDTPQPCDNDTRWGMRGSARDTLWQGNPLLVSLFYCFLVDKHTRCISTTPFNLNNKGKERGKKELIRSDTPNTQPGFTLPPPSTLIGFLNPHPRIQSQSQIQLSATSILRYPNHKICLIT